MNTDKRQYLPFRRRVFTWLCLLPILFLTACDMSDEAAEFLELAIDWALEKKLLKADCPPPYDSEDCNIGVNTTEIARWKASQTAGQGGLVGNVVGGLMTLTGTEKVDPELGAALDAGEVVYTMERADSLAQEGLEENNLDKIDQAIKMRPEDWSYHDSKAALLLSQGDPEAAQASFNQAEELVADRIKNSDDPATTCRTLQLNMLRNREQALFQQSQLHPTNEQLRNELGITQSQIFDLENHQAGNPCNTQ
jgi:tetratricopeptide (TPR) repeat protein